MNRGNNLNPLSNNNTSPLSNAGEEKQLPFVPYDPSEDEIILAYNSFYDRPITDVIETYITDPVKHAALAHRFDNVNRTKAPDLEQLRKIAEQYEADLEQEEKLQHSIQATAADLSLSSKGKVSFLRNFYSLDKINAAKASKYQQIGLDHNLPDALLRAGIELIEDSDPVKRQTGKDYIELARTGQCPDAARLLYLVLERASSRKSNGQQLFAVELEDKDYLQHLLVESANLGDRNALRDLGHIEPKNGNIDQAKNYYQRAVMLGCEDSIFALTKICLDENKMVQAIYYHRCTLESAYNSMTQWREVQEKVISYFGGEDKIFSFHTNPLLAFEIKYHFVILLIRAGELMMRDAPLSQPDQNQAMIKQLGQMLNQMARENPEAFANQVLLERSYEKIKNLFEDDVRKLVELHVAKLDTLLKNDPVNLPTVLSSLVLENLSMFSPQKAGKTTVITEAKNALEAKTETSDSSTTAVVSNKGNTPAKKL